MSRRHCEFSSPDSGSVLLVAVIFAAILGVLVTSYLNLAMGEYEQADASFMHNALVNLTEAGTDEAIWSIQRQDWTGWVDLGTYMGKSLTGFDLGSGKMGTVRILVQNYDSTPVIYTEGSASGYNTDRTIPRQIRVGLVNRSPFANGLSAKEDVTVDQGTASIDSYDSSAGPPDPFFNRNDNGSMVSVSVVFNDPASADSSIYGYVATAGTPPPLGSAGMIYGPNWMPGDPMVDPSRLTYDYTGEFSDVDPPTMSPGALGDSDSDIVYLTDPAGSPGSRTITGGLPELPIEYHLTDFRMNYDREMIITGHVLIRVDGDVDLTNLTINPYSTLTVFVEGRMDVAGLGFSNGNDHADSFVVYGTNDVDQVIDFDDCSDSTAAIYAPNALVELDAGGAGPGFSGAAVAKNLFLQNGVQFHYDERLKEFQGPNPSYRMENWLELVKKNDRVDFSSWSAAVASAEALPL